MNLKRHLVAEFHHERCDRQTLIPMLDKLDDREIEALYRLLQNAKSDSERRGRRNLSKLF